MTPPAKHSPVAAAETLISFGDALAARVADRESQLVIGLDPDPSALWPGVAEGPARSAQPPFADPVASAVLAHCNALIDAVAPACVALKPQLACFERLGHPGRTLLGAVLEHARQAGLLVIADGKRGDIDVTARAYAQALYGGIDTPFGTVAGLGVDAATVNPLLGRDALEPFVSAARARGAGVLALVRTSNRGAADVQDLELAGGGAVWERLAGIVDELGRPGIGACGLSDVGAVLGATVPWHLARARELMPHAVLLLPGVGLVPGLPPELDPPLRSRQRLWPLSRSRSVESATLPSRGGSRALAWQP